jgi:hypothetical protein
MPHPNLPHARPPARRLLLLLATVTDWWTFATRGVGALEVWGGVSLHALGVCYDDRGGRQRWTNSRFCSYVTLGDVAWALDYFRVAGGLLRKAVGAAAATATHFPTATALHHARPRTCAGAVAFTFVLVPLLLVGAANYFVNMRRREVLDARIHPRLGAFKSYWLPLGLYATSGVLLTVA